MGITRLTWFHKRDSSLLSHLLPSQPPLRTITVWLSWAQLCLKSPAQQTRSSRRMPCLPLAQLAPPENLLQQDQQPTKYATIVPLGRMRTLAKLAHLAQPEILLQHHVRRNCCV